MAPIFGSKADVMRRVAKDRIATFKSLANANPAGVYHSFFASQGEIPFMTRLSMVNQAPLAALGIGPKSWRTNAVSTRQTLSNEAKKNISRMAIS